jgi:NADH-quinone oxidoreductase subunit F
VARRGSGRQAGEEEGIEDLSKMATQSLNLIYREKDVPNIHKLDVYVKHGGYEGLKKALGMKPGEVVDVVKSSNLRGRGGAGFPTGVKWSFIPQTEPIKYVVVNADESETGTFKDRQILENNPHQLIEGALIAAWAIQAKAVYIYLRGEFWDVAHALDKHIAEAEKAGYAGENILNSGWSCPVYTHLGAGAYICGEESALLESLEGKLGQPRVRPPFPAQKGGGLYAEPTVVNNVETLANVPWIISNGADAFKAIGTDKSSGTKVFCLSGHVNKPGNYELPFGATFRELIFEHGGGMIGGKKVKAILPSGGSGPIIEATDEVLDTPLTYESLAKFGSILGSASVIVMDEDTDIAWVASKDRVMAGEAKESDVDLITNIARNMQGVTLCALGDFAANPAIYTIRNFPDDFRKHVKA